MGRNQQSKGGGYAGNKGNKTYASGGKGGGNKKTVDAATALGLGLPSQNTMLSGMAGLGMAQPNPLDSLFGTMGTNTMAGLGGLGTSLQSANSGNDLLQLAALLGGAQQQSVTFQPAQLLQVRQALQQQQATQLAAQQAELKKRIDAEAATQAAELVKEHEKAEKLKQKKTQEANATKQDDDGDTVSRGSANGRSQGVRKRKAIAAADAERQKVEKERDELREALDMIESHLGTCARQYDSEDGTRPSRVKKTAVTRTLRSVSRKGARLKEPEIVDLDDESVSERVARLIALPVVAGGSSSPYGRRPPPRQSPRLFGESDRSTGSDMRSGSMPKSGKGKLKSLSFAAALVDPTPEEKKARERVDARKRRNKKPEEGKEEKKNEAFVIRQSFDNIGRELISLVSTTLREIGKQDIEAPTKADMKCSCPWLRR